MPLWIGKAFKTSTTQKVDEMQLSGTDTIEFHILPRHIKGKGHVQLRRHKMETRAETRGDSSFPADGNQVILNKMNTKSKTNTKRTNIDN